MTAYHYDKSRPGHSCRTSTHLPPRISLRWLAGHTVLFYLMLCMVVSYFSGYGPLTFLFVIYGLWFLYVCVKSVFTDPKTEAEVDLNVSDCSLGSYSFNDSF